MRLIPLVFLSFVLTACSNTSKKVDSSVDNDASGTDVSEIKETKSVEVVSDETNGKVRYVMQGYLTKEQIREQFEKIQASGIDTSKPYKWEFRFTSKIMSALEDFTQTAHMLEFWPVALESSVNADMYWLYIQKTQQYDKEQFVDEISKLMNMAEYWKIRTFDGFSVDNPDSVAEK